jgi:hypothetical protein
VPEKGATAHRPGGWALPVDGMRGRLDDFARNPGLLTGSVVVLAAVVLWLLVRPLAGATNDTDSMATVLYFDRIVHGQRLEAFVPTTPKPLLTLAYGLAWSLTGDWRSLTILTIGAGALAVGFAARLAGRLAGPGAAAFAVIGLLVWPEFQQEVANANSFVWGLGLWLLAGVLITADRPRPWLAGLALLLAGLVRTETIWLLAVAVASVGFLALRALRGGDRRAFRTALPLLLGALAIPLACLHDWLLTGRPLYWLGVPAGYTAQAYPNLAAVAPLSTLKSEAVHFEPMWPLLGLAILGGLTLMATRHRTVALALAALAAGVLATLVLLAWRGVYISARYYEEADAAVLLAAAVGGAWLAGWAVDRTRGRASDWLRSRAAGLGWGAVLVAVAAVALVGSSGNLDSQLMPGRDSNARLAEQLPRLESVLGGASGAVIAVSGVDYPVVDQRSCRAFVPRRMVAEISVETGTPTTALCDSYLAFRDGNEAALRSGQWVLHVAAADGSAGVYSPFEHSTTTTVIGSGGTPVELVPVFVDQAEGVWLFRVAAGPGA